MKTQRIEEHSVSNLRIVLLGLAVAALTFGPASRAVAAAQTWSGGDGTWQVGDSGKWGAPWANGDTATFAGSGGPYTVTVVGPITVGNAAALAFTGPNYTLSASSAQTISLANSVVSVIAGTTMTLGTNVTLTRDSGSAKDYDITGGGTVVIGRGATVTQTSANTSQVGSGTTMRVTGGNLALLTSLVVGRLDSGVTLNGTLLVEDGIVTIGGSGNLIVGRSAGDVSLFTISGGSVGIGSELKTDNGTATMNLNGGVVTACRVFRTAGSLTLNFAGGTLKASTTASAVQKSTFLTGVTAVNINAGGGVFDSNGQEITIGQALLDGGGGGSITKVGAGVLTLAGTNTYTGFTTVSNGTLMVGTATVTTNNYIVSDGAGFGVKLLANGGSLAISNLTFGTNRAQMNFDLGTLGNPSAVLANLRGDLTMGGDVIVNVTWNTYTPSTNVLLSYAGSRQGAFAFLPGSLPIGTSLIDDTVNKQLKLAVTITAPPLLAWRVGNGDWDFATPNWTNLVTGSVSSLFTNGAAVRFDDTASGATPIGVNIPAAVSPGSVAANNNAKQFSLSGAPITGGTGLTMQGTNVLVLGGANSFTGTVTVLAGVIQATNNDALGSANAGTVVADTAAIALSGDVTCAERITIGGPGPLKGIAGSQIVNLQRGAIQSASGNNVWSGNITVADNNNTRIGTQDSAQLTVTGVISDGGAGYTVLVRVGANGTVTLSGPGGSLGALQTFGDNGGTGVTLLGADNAVPTNARLDLGLGKFDLNGFNQTVNGLGDFGTGAELVNNGSVATLTISTTNNNSCSAAIYGNLNLLKANSGSQILAGYNSYTGTTTVNGGSLLVNGDNSQASGTVSVTAGGTLGGAGIIGGAVAVYGTLSPGSNTIGTLTVNSNLTLAGSTFIEADALVTNADQVVVLNDVIYGGSLAVSNRSATPLMAGQVYQLFTASGSKSGNFTTPVTMLGSGSSGVVATFNPATGQLTLSTSPVLPKPYITQVSISGGSLILQGTNGAPSATYSILTSTNVALPLSNWTTNSTGTFTASGTFSNSIAVGGEPQGFFLIKQP